MKRPRRPTKKIARKRVSKERNKIIAGLREALGVATGKKKAARVTTVHVTAADPFHINPRLIPAGWAYQWVPQGSKLAEGWTAVPYSRHAHDFPDDYSGMFGQINFLGLALVETTIGQAQKERDALKQKAIDLHGSFDEQIGRDGGKGHGFWIMPQGWNVSEEVPDAPPVEGPSVEVAITLMMKVPARWASAAAYLKLTLNEYTRRRILMERPLLGALDPFASETLYEAVNLIATPAKEV